MTKESTRRLRFAAFAVVVAFAGLAGSTPATAADPLRALIVDGRNNHDWRTTTTILKADLEQSGRFHVDVATAPPTGAAESTWDDFRPSFADYDVVVLNYNAEPWPKPVREALEAYVRKGGGLAVIHAANNAFADWPAYNQMIGLGWRGPDFDDRITIDDAGQIVRTPKGEGPGAGHGARHAYKVVVRDPEHPITRGMPRAWLHPVDELYHGQRGPAQNMNVLAYAYSDKAKGGTGANEPLVWVVAFGDGRVFTNVMGHVGGGDARAAEGADFRSLLQRGAEWAATGAATIPIPNDFPAAER